MKILLLLSFLVVSFMTNAQKNFKGAELYSNQTWKYGKIEVRMRMAKGSGILSTFFTYKDGSEIAGTFWEEIDIEVFGKDNAETFQSNIITNNPKKYSEDEHHMDFSLADDYHTYTLEWTPDYLAWYLDGKEVRRSQGGQVQELTSPQSFRFNIWAANIVEWVGNFDTGALPAHQFVNWIKYSAYTPGAGDNGSDFKLDWQDDFDSFNSTRWSKADWTFNENLVDFDPANVVIKDGYLVLVISRAGETGYSGAVPQDELLTSVAENSNNAQVGAFPNPTTAKLTITGSFNDEWTLFGILGEKVMQGKTSEIDMEGLPCGTYMLHINNIVKRIVKK